MCIITSTAERGGPAGSEVQGPGCEGARENLKSINASMLLPIKAPKGSVRLHYPAARPASRRPWLYPFYIYNSYDQAVQKANDLSGSMGL